MAVVLLRRSLANPLFQQLAMYIQIAHRPGGSPNLLENLQHPLGRLLQLLDTVDGGFAQHGLQRCLQPARTGSYLMHRIRIRILDALRCSRVEVVRKRIQLSQQVQYGFRPDDLWRPTAGILLLAYCAFRSHVESLRSFPRGASREYF